MPVAIDVAADGEEALFLFLNGAYDAVLMDMMMPKMDGVAATRAIRDLERARNFAPTPIIMLTANAMQTHVDQALDAGCNAHLPKPVTARSLVRAVRQACVDALPARSVA